MVYAEVTPSPVRVRCIFRDVTARKEAEQKILRSYELQTVIK